MSLWLRACGAGLLAAFTTGCGAPYLLRAAYEEARILLRREPIAEVLAREDLDAPTREKLRLVLTARQFARDTIGFEVGQSYATFARVDENAVAYVVTAAYRDRLEAYSWRYPIVGRVPYRGFFDRGPADAYAETLEDRHLDTAVWPTTAFSTLGWFADPLLSSMLAQDAVELVSVVFHELAHAFLYVRSAAAFNESFANFVGHRAAIAFFCTEGLRQSVARVDYPSHPSHPSHPPSHPNRCTLAEERWHDERVYATVLEEVADALTAMYEASSTAGAREEARRQILATASTTLERRPLRTQRYRGRDLTMSNNAVLVQQLLYRRELEQFEAVWRTTDGDLRRTVARISAAVKETTDPFAGLARLASPLLPVAAAVPILHRPCGLPWTRCSAAWPGGCGSSGRTRPMARTSPASRSSGSLAATDGSFSPATLGFSASTICRRACSSRTIVFGSSCGRWWRHTTST